jgi:pantoate--beta-alanine ligase
MKEHPRVAELRSALSSSPGPVALVPTMGYLHEGHLSLIRRARGENRTVVVSIFVNPSQFGPNEDFTRYPRDMDRDRRLCDEAGVDHIFAPEVSEMYPPGDRTIVEVTELQDRWEGASRPGHFRGVATVVAKLFRIVRPDRAYFGEKDYQQLQIVTRMATDLFLDLEVVGCPTVREPDGLALSSRNVYLDPAGRQAALGLSRALQAAQADFGAGERRRTALERRMERVAHDYSGFELDYAVVVDPHTLEQLQEVNAESRALIAGWVSGVKLIDNAAIAPV